MAVLLQLDEKLDGWLATLPLALYAAEHWVDHAKFENVASRIENAMQDLFNPERPHLRAWTSIHDMDRVHHGDVWRRRNPPPIAKATALYYAVSCGFSRLARHLILVHADDANAKCGQYGTPLHVASYMGHVDAVRVLLEYGADVNVTNSSGISPLLEACTCNHPEVVRLLLEHGADVEAEARLAVGFHRRPLHIASGDGRMEIVQLLLQHNAEVNARNDVLMTPLHYASSRGHLEVAQLLLEHNADINLRSKVNDTPIRLASQNGSLGVVRLLLRRGADVNTPGFCGLTALQAACERGHHEVARLLLEYGAH
jgi:ankyrin repeat protein